MFIVIVTTVGDLETKQPWQKNLPANYPADCREFDSLEDAQKAFPGKMVMPLAEYQGYARALTHIYNESSLVKPWWKFWG